MFLAQRLRAKWYRRKEAAIPTGEVYPGGYEALLGHARRREAPMQRIGKALPPGRVDLDALSVARIPEDLPLIQRRPTNDAREKLQHIRQELAGHSELAAIHGLTMAILRRSTFPPRVRRLFFRMWKEKGDFLVDTLPTRWLVSAATTFADHGRNPDQRLAGLALVLLFDLVKLHDSERRLSGRPNSVPFPRNERFHLFDLACGLPPYQMETGDLDKMLLVRVWRLCQRDPLVRPLANRLLEMLQNDPRSVFARVQSFKNAATPKASEKRAP